jgi:hypothetical protein
LIQRVSQTGTENESITILICLTLSKAIQNLSEQGQDKKQMFLECRWYNLRIDRTIYKAKAGIKVLFYFYSWEVLDRIVPHKHAETKQRVEEHNCCFSKKNGEQRYQYLVIGRDKYYFVKSHSKSNKKSKQNVIIQILDFDDWTIICPIWWTSVSTNDWYFNRYEEATLNQFFKSRF